MIAAEDIIQTKTADFVGRDYVFTAVEKFIQDHDRGFLVLEGDPGAGKTAILAEYIRRTHCIGHFNLRAQGLNTAGHFVRSLSQQLTARYGAHPAASADGGEAVSHLLREVRAGLPDELPLVIAVDALDETEAAPGAANPLYLPGILDKGVYLVLTTRRNTTTLRADGPFQRIDLKDFHDQTMEDVRRHLENKLSEEALARLVDDSHLSRDAVVARLGEMSEGNFMYLYYTLIDLARSPGLDLDRFLSELPQGLENYYAAHWESMGMAAAEAPTVNAWILYVLCESETPCPPGSSRASSPVRCRRRTPPSFSAASPSGGSSCTRTAPPHRPSTACTTPVSVTSCTVTMSSPTPPSTSPTSARRSPTCCGST